MTNSKKRLFVLQATTSCPLKCVDIVVYSYVLFKSLAKKKPATIAAIARGTGLGKRNAIPRALRNLSELGLATKDGGRYVAEPCPTSWFHVRHGSKPNWWNRFRYFVFYLPKPSTLSVKQSLLYWKLQDLKRSYGAESYAGGLWRFGTHRFGSGAIARILHVNKSTVVRSIAALRTRGLLDANNKLVDLPDTWQDSIRPDKTKPELQYKHATEHPVANDVYRLLVKKGYTEKSILRIMELNPVGIENFAAIEEGCYNYFRQQLSEGKQKSNDPGPLLLAKLKHLGCNERDKVETGIPKIELPPTKLYNQWDVQEATGVSNLTALNVFEWFTDHVWNTVKDRTPDLALQKQMNMIGNVKHRVLEKTIPLLKGTTDEERIKDIFRDNLETALESYLSRA